MAKKTNPKRKNKRNAGTPRPQKAMSIMSDPRVRAWDQLLRDPCSADLAPPCYTGVDNGYLIRTTDFVTPVLAGTFTAGTVLCDYALQISPFNFSSTTGGVAAQSISGVALPALANFGFSTNFICGTSVKRYRPVAACVKWIPSGKYSDRSGVVSIGYLPGQELVSGVTVTATAARSLCQQYAPNGAAHHEVRWLPTAADEAFTTVSAPLDTGAGSVIIVLTGVDATQTTTTQTLNGSVEITVVWEWAPSVTAGGLTVSPKAPLPYNSQQVLGTISDLGAYIFEGVRTVASHPGVINAAAQAANMYLSRGIGRRGFRGSAMTLM